MYLQPEWNKLCSGWKGRLHLTGNPSMGMEPRFPGCQQGNSRCKVVQYGSQWRPENSTAEQSQSRQDLPTEILSEQLRCQLYRYTVGNTGFLFQRSDNNFKFLVCRMSRIVKNSQVNYCLFLKRQQHVNSLMKNWFQWLKYFVSWVRLIENLVVFMDEISNTHYLREQEIYIRRFNFMRAVESRLMFL